MTRAFEYASSRAAIAENRVVDLEAALRQAAQIPHMPDGLMLHVFGESDSRQLCPICKTADLNSAQVVVGSPEKLRDHNLVARLRAHLAAADPYRLAQRVDMPSMLTDESKGLLREAADALEAAVRAIASRPTITEVINLRARAEAAEARAEKLERLAASATSYLEPHNSLRDELARLQNPDKAQQDNECWCGATNDTDCTCKRQNRTS